MYIRFYIYLFTTFIKSLRYKRMDNETINAINLLYAGEATINDFSEEVLEKVRHYVDEYTWMRLVHISNIIMLKRAITEIQAHAFIRTMEKEVLYHDV